MIRQLIVWVAVALVSTSVRAADADVILHNGKVATVDKDFTIQQAIAIGGERILKGACSTGASGKNLTLDTRAGGRLGVDSCPSPAHARTAR